MSFSSATTETLVFESPAGQLYYQPAAYVRLAWAAGRQPLPVVQAYYEQVLLLLQRTDVRRILSEHGPREPLLPAAQEWIIGNWIPRAMQQAHTCHCAIVDGANPIHRLATQSIVSSSPTSFHFHRFDTLAAADTWLRGLAV